MESEPESCVEYFFWFTVKFCRRYLAILLIGTFVVCLVCGDIELHYGGSFWQAVKSSSALSLGVAFAVYSLAMFNDLRCSRLG